MDDTTLGRQYADGETICEQGDVGDRMFVVQSGRAVVTRKEHGFEVVLGTLGAGDLFGEMAIFDREPRSATVRAEGSARVMTLDKRGFLKRVHEDPSLAYRLLRDLSRRVRTLDQALSETRRAAGAPQYVVVVARDRPELHRRLQEDFAGHDAIRVVLDRRSPSPDGAKLDGDERRRQESDELMQAHGLIVVRSADSA